MRKPSLLTWTLGTFAFALLIANITSLLSPISQPGSGAPVRNWPKPPAAPDIAKLLIASGPVQGSRRSVFTIAPKPAVGLASKALAPGNADFLLKGIISHEKNYTAFLARTNVPGMLRLREGDQFEGWVVEKITHKSVWLNAGHDARRLTLGAAAN